MNSANKIDGYLALYIFVFVLILTLVFQHYYMHHVFNCCKKTVTVYEQPYVNWIQYELRDTIHE